jgi:alpha-mannosidase
MRAPVYCLTFFVCTMLLTAKAPRRIYIAPDDHTDYIWSADEKTYERAIVHMIEYYLDLADRTDDGVPRAVGS